MNRTFLYKLNGEYWGFILKNRIYNKNSIYKGWVDKKNICWNFEGKYLGEIFNEFHIIKKNIYIEPVSRVPKIPRVVPAKIADRPNIKAKILSTNYYDVLENI